MSMTLVCLKYIHAVHVNDGRAVGQVMDRDMTIIHGHIYVHKFKDQCTIFNTLGNVVHTRCTVCRGPFYKNTGV